MIEAGQPSLFPLPPAVAFNVTPAQQLVLDWLEFVACCEHRHDIPMFPDHLSKKALRNLIARGLVEVTEGRWRYQLTATGRATRNLSKK